jgi:hypothetical protein
MSKGIPEIHSNAQLLKAALVAVAIAAVVLVTTILPAEYGIDPTGLGGRMGLTVLNPDEAPTATPDATAPSASAPALDAVGQPLKPVQAAVVSKRDREYRQDTLSLTLPPGKGAEIKAAMKSGDGFVFHWTASSDVAVDMHGEPTGAVDDEYTSYWIEPALRVGAGTFTASFDGTHGWYWLNRGTSEVTVEVEVSGFQEKLFIP